MSDNLKRYCAILRHLKQLSPTEPTFNAARHLQTFNAARHLQTLAALVSGIIGSKSCQLPAIASQVPRGASPKGGKRESRSKRFARFLQNKKVTPKTFFLPYAQALVQSLPPGPLVLVMDGSVVGQGCMALMLSVLYDCAAGSGRPLKRALPLCRLVTKAPKGHFTQERHQVHSGASSSSLRSVIKFTQERHQELLAQVKRLIPAEREVIFIPAEREVIFIPAEREVIFLGDGEFDGCGLLADITKAGWHYVCRTAKNVLLAQADWPDETFSLSDLGLQPGDSVEMTDVLFTAQVVHGSGCSRLRLFTAQVVHGSGCSRLRLFTAQGLGPVLVGAVWERGQTEPLLLVTNLDFLHEARSWYKKRFGIETFFSDQKSRGFYLCHSHLSDPARLCRLLMATCLAYYWLVCLGAEVVQCGWQSIIHRTKRYKTL